MLKFGRFWVNIVETNRLVVNDKNRKLFFQTVRWVSVLQTRGLPLEVGITQLVSTVLKNVRPTYQSGPDSR